MYGDGQEGWLEDHLHVCRYFLVSCPVQFIFAFGVVFVPVLPPISVKVQYEFPTGRTDRKFVRYTDEQGGDNVDEEDSANEK